MLYAAFAFFCSIAGMTVPWAHRGEDWSRGKHMAITACLVPPVLGRRPRIQKIEKTRARKKGAPLLRLFLYLAHRAQSCSTLTAQAMCSSQGPLNFFSSSRRMLQHWRRNCRTLWAKTVPKTSLLYEALFWGPVGSLHCFAFACTRPGSLFATRSGR